MKKAWRLRSGADFQRVREANRSWANPLLILQMSQTQPAGGPTRIGITANKRVGGAVIRNRAKRRVREALRLRYHHLAPGWDLVFIVRPALVDAGVEALARAVDSLLARAGIWVAAATKPAEPLSREAECATSPSG
jgi:ribonuclease P protein component